MTLCKSKLLGRLLFLTMAGDEGERTAGLNGLKAKILSRLDASLRCQPLSSPILDPPRRKLSICL